MAFNPTSPKSPALFPNLFLFLFLFLIVSCVSNQGTSITPFSHKAIKEKKEVVMAVVSAHPLASEIGLKILKQGGNAFDAAIATQLALAVVHPSAGNLGGGGFMVSVDKNGKMMSLDYREKAPSAAHRDMFLDVSGNVVEGKSTKSHLASGVPGTVAGLFETFKYAKLPFSKLIQPSIELANGGFVLTAGDARSYNGLQEEMLQVNTVPNAFTRRFNQGDTLKQPDLAKTLERIRDSGMAGFYGGTTAFLIEEEMRRGKGIISKKDLADYRAVWRDPHTFSYRNHTVVSMPMPSSGGLLLNQMLKMTEFYPLGSYGYNSVAAVQLMTEVERRAYADRAQYMGDADFYPVPAKTLGSVNYLKKRMEDYKPGIAGKSSTVKAGVVKESEETTHLSVMDKEGNAVAVTTTLNGSYGNKLIVGGAGFFLNNEMDDFSVKPGVPNMYGAVGGEANAIAPGKRMLSSMTPTIVLKNGKPWIVTGTPGGTTITTSVFQTIVNIIDFKLDPFLAVQGPKFHHQWLPDRLDLEKKFPSQTRDSLARIGYEIFERSEIGRVELIIRKDNGKLHAVADQRGYDSVAGD